MLNYLTSQLPHSKPFQLLVGILGIHITYLLHGILFEHLTTKPYLNRITRQQTLFESSSGIVLATRACSWILGQLYLWVFISQEEIVHQAIENIEFTGFLIFLSSITSVSSIYYVNFPLFTIMKSSEVLSVVLVGVLCTRVHSQQLKLSKNKVIVGVVIAIGIIIYKWFDPQLSIPQPQDNKQKNQSHPLLQQPSIIKSHSFHQQAIGISLLLISLLIDGFIPDYQQSHVFNL